jgi:hypothetical protein
MTSNDLLAANERDVKRLLLEIAAEPGVGEDERRESLDRIERTLKVLRDPDDYGPAEPKGGST